MINGSKLRDLRLSVHISQAKLSLETDVDQALISKIENGHRMYVAFVTIERLADFFNIPVDELRTKTDKL